MIAEIRDGFLIIAPQTQTENYALKKFMEQEDFEKRIQIEVE